MHRADLERVARFLGVVLLGMLLGACQTTGPRQESNGPVKVIQASGEIPEDQLMDVGIEVFSPGEVEGDGIESAQVMAEIRKAEARFIPVHLKNTLQRTGHWGLVRVVPEATDAFEVLVRGEILASDGQRLFLRVDAYDATGKRWFSKFYDSQAGPGAYRKLERGSSDAFQGLYNTIANDLARYRSTLERNAVRDIKRVSELRFAAALASDAFGDHLLTTAPSPAGFRKVARLPADGDPMIERVRRIRERDYMLIDTLDGYYDNFYDDMWPAYASWRQFRGEELESMREVQREARNQKLLGVATVIGGVAMALLSGNSSSMNLGGLGTAMAVGGTIYAKQGFDRGAEVEMHQEAIRELTTSFEAEVQPLVVEVEGETVELSGSARTQYAAWRAMLKDIYATENGTLPALEGRPVSYVDDDAPTPLAVSGDGTGVPVPGGCGAGSETSC